MRSQLRFNKFNSKNEEKNKNQNKGSLTSSSSSSSSSLPLSSEMTAWLDQTFTATDDDGYLPEMVGSSLTQPLDSFAAFCPTGNLLQSKFTSTRIPSTHHHHKNGLESNMSQQYSTSSSKNKSFRFTADLPENENENDHFAGEPEQKIIDFDSTLNRLNVMWLQRKAKLEEEDGDLSRSIQTIQEAINLHVGSPRSYEKAGLSDPVHGSNPLELMVEIEKNYFPYDATSHRIADKLQRWYHRFYSKKTSAASIVQRRYRKYLHLRQVWRNLQVQLQCSKLIQRRFRTHLKRMNSLATKLKAWYLMRVKMREYEFLIRFYRAARFIQRLTRGMWGRKIAARRRLEQLSSMRIQRNARGYICRKRRAWALSQYHKIYYYAALKIQCFCRRLIAITRCQRQLLEEIMREEIRMEKEKAIRDETIQLELSRTRIYLKTAAGKLHYEACKKRILAQDEEFNEQKPLLSPQEMLAHEALIIFEMYDADGSGTIDREELKFMLIDLCVPVDDMELARIALQLDENGSGDIDFEEFIDWYSNGGNDGGSSSMSGMMFKQLLKARRLVLELSGELLKRRAERAVLRQCCSWLSNETKSMFRMTHAPKFNCCRCLEPFVLFTDYLRHFKGHGDNRVCCVTGERGLFYPKFWVQNDWLKQRQCESEVMRVTYEYPCLTYKAMMAVYSELAILSNPELSFLLSNQIHAASEMYKTEILQFHEPLLQESTPDPDNGTSIDQTKPKFYQRDLSEYIYDIANLCNDGFLSPNIAHCISRCLDEDLPKDWIVHDQWKLNLFSDWLHSLPKLIRPIPDSDSVCFSLLCFQGCQSPNKVREKDCYLLGNIFVRCVRLLLVGAETSLISLAEYRLKRPRRITISDGELKKNKLHLLTRESFDTVRVKLIKRLRIIRDSLRKLQICAINFHKLRENRKFLKILNRSLRSRFGLSSPPPIDVITEDPTDEEIETYEIESAHIRAKAHYQYRQKSRIGKAHLSRMKYELWAKRRQINSELMRSNSFSPFTQQQSHPNEVLVAYVEYLMNIFTIPEFHPNEIHHRDLELLLSCFFYLNIPTSPTSLSIAASEDYQKILDQLDPNGTGYIGKQELCNWLLSGQHLQYFSQWKRIQYCSLPFIGAKDAKYKILCDMRRITRHEIEAQKHALLVIDTLLEIEEADQRESGLLQQQQEGSRRRIEKQKSNMKKNRKLLTSKLKQYQEENETCNERLKHLKRIFDQQEQRVLSRISEDDAEYATKRKMFFTKEGRYFLSMEILLMKIARETIYSFGEIIPSSSSLPSTRTSSTSSHRVTLIDPTTQTAVVTGDGDDRLLVENLKALSQCLSILIHCFDTDCSGTFDESEITLLLKCVKCSLPEKWVLFYFPDVVDDSASLGQVVSHLLPRVGWSRSLFHDGRFQKDIQISTKSFLYSSSLLLISSSRQSARDKANQAAELVNTGILLQTGDEESEEGKGNNGGRVMSEGLLVRCQLLAVRQTIEYLKTPFGHIRKLCLQKDFLQLWKTIVVPDQFSKISLIRYTFHIFQLDQVPGHGDSESTSPLSPSHPSRFLNSELPHIIRYVSLRFRWKLKENTCHSLSSLFKFTEESDARWIFFDELVEILETSFDHRQEHPPSSSNSSLFFFDSQFRMESISRQQALLIAMDFPEINVKETNYRCYILGMYRCLEMMRSSSSSSSSSSTLNHSYDSSDLDPIDWECVPYETILLYLLAQGFTYEDLISKKHFYQSEDVIDYDHTVNPEKLLSQAMEEIFSQLTCSSSIYRLVRYVTGFQHFHSYSQLVKLIYHHRVEINAFGRMFLNEIITGVSHCSFDS